MVGGIVGVEYYVYQVSISDEVVYVGKGKGGRYKHATSGKSHNFKLNKYYFEHLLLGKEQPRVDIVARFEHEYQALKYEKFLISDLLPECNIRLVPVENSLQKSSKEDVTTNLADEDIYVEEIPNNYESLKIYLKDLYKDYLDNSSAIKPHPLKWYVYAKKSLVKFQDKIPMLDRFLDELTKDEVVDLGGRPAKFQTEFNMNPSEKAKFWRFFTKKKGIQLDVNNKDHYNLVEAWINFIRQGGKNKNFNHRCL